MRILLILMFAAVCQAQQPTPKPTPKPPVEQNIHVVPDVIPANLADEIKKLNAAGYAVQQSNLMIIDNKITIFIGDAEEDCEDCGDRNHAAPKVLAETLPKVYTRKHEQHQIHRKRRH